MRLIFRRMIVWLTVLLFLVTAFTPAQDSTTLVVTGSSMPEPLYQAWNDSYHKRTPSVQIRYLAGGTAESVHNVLVGSGDFGGGDAPIPEKELRASGSDVLELPTVLIGIVVVYNVPGTAGELKLTGSVLGSIFLGKIKSWNDPAIAKLNPGVTLPDLSIEVLHRTEGKGSNYIFSDYLSKISPEFLSIAGRGESPKWPVGASFKRSQDLLEKAKATSGSIGYTELNLAAKSGLHIASIKNAAGDFVMPSTKSIAAAATAVGSKMSGDFRVSLTNAPGKDSYPISSYTWFYVPAKSKDPQRSHAISEYLRWAYSSGQQIAQDQGYAPLPEDVLNKVVAKLASIH